MSNTDDKPIRVLLVDDHAIIREGLGDLIRSRPGMTVVGDADTRADAVALAAREQPDVIVLDLDLGADSGLDVLPELLRFAVGASVIILTGMRDTEKRDRAMELGAKGVVLKERGAAKRLLDKQRTRATEQADPEAAKIATLTPTERELITCIGDGLDNRQIAA